MESIFSGLTRKINLIVLLRKPKLSNILLRKPKLSKSIFSPRVYFAKLSTDRKYSSFEKGQ